jgi:signal transduction histidine kinase
VSEALPPRFLRGLGLVTAAAAAPLAAPARPPWTFDPLWLLGLALYLALFAGLGGKACRRWSFGPRLAAVLGAGAVGLALAATGSGAFGAVYPVLVAALAGSLLRPAAAYGVVAAQAVALATAWAVVTRAPGRVLLIALVFGALQLFVAYTAIVARSESAARRELEAAHDRLSAARGELALASRDAERLRITRDLHDVMGHHLTALSLTLETAAHAPGAAQAEQVAEAQVLVKRLLRDLRRVVSKLRETPADLGAELRRLAAEAKSPAIHLRLDDGLPAAPPELAGALLACAREAATNAGRHGRAANLWLTLRRQGDAWLLTAEDDGRGAGATKAEGHGLRGLAERLDALGGSLATGPGAKGGFELRARVPAAGGGAR